MARSLYRFYLYTVFIILLIFAVSATTQLLNTLLSFTPLRGTDGYVPSRSDLVQSLIFAVVGWIISGTLGGLHYWLIRRDILHDPAAGTSGIRSFFLNATEAFGALLTVSLIGFGVLENWAYSNGMGNLVGATAAGLPTLAMVVLLELERRRTPARKGAALVFQRLHFFGVQLIFLFYLTGAFLSAFRPLIDGVFFGGRGATEACAPYEYPCSLHYNLFGFLLTILWFVACWLLYSLATSTDSSRNTRMIMHGLGLGYAIISGLSGASLLFELLLLPLYHIPVGFKDVLGPFAQYDFFSPLLLGVLVIAIYHWLLRNASQRGLIGTQVRRLTEWAIAGILLGITFWIGADYGLYNLLETLAPTPSVPDGRAWIATIALLVTGLSYVPLDLYLWKRYVQDPATTTGPRRGFVLALLGGGILALAIGGITALYASGTALLGSPITNWLQITHTGLASAIVGAIVVGIYLWATRREHLLAGRPQPVPPPTPIAPTETPTIESIIDDLLAGRINREEAVARLHELTPIALVQTE
jgi:hypothetical protein